MPPIFSIMMPAYNAEGYISQSVDSALSQSFPSFELIIVDDGSTDGTAAIVNQYADKRIRVIHQANGGEAAARNTALEHARGTYLAFLDADDLYLPEHLEVAFGYLQSNPDCGGVYTDGHYLDDEGRVSKVLSDRRRGPFEGDIFEEVIRASDVFGAPVCVVLRRDIIAHHRLVFDPEIVIGPDWDFLARFAAVATFGYLDLVTCCYRVHGTNISLRTDTRKRALSLATCRERAIGMQRFADCSVNVRRAVFYDLLVNLLRGFPERQSQITSSRAFADLPTSLQAELFRLMASAALVDQQFGGHIAEWLRCSRTLDPANARAALLASLYNFSPQACRLMLLARRLRQADQRGASPFADLARS